jgi:hypothetical protein
MTPSSNRQQDLLLALGAFLVALVLWQFRPFSPIIFPLRLFVTFIHELGHGTATLATGGHFISFEVESTRAGATYYSGGIQEIIIPAGYMGTAIFGAVLLFLANRASKPQQVAVMLGSAFIMLTLFYSGLGLSNFNLLEIIITLSVLLGAGVLFWNRSTSQGRILSAVGLGLGILLLVYFAAGDNLLTVLVGVLWGIGLILVGAYGRRDLALFILNFLAFAVGLNAITDAWFLLRIVSNSNAHNDAVFMANAAPLPAEFWAALWMAFAVLLLGASCWWVFVRRQKRG